MGYGVIDRGLIPGRGKNFAFFIASKPALGPNQALIQWVQCGKPAVAGGVVITSEGGVALTT
jgi:hypothetical protein